MPAKKRTTEQGVPREVPDERVAMEKELRANIRTSLPQLKKLLDDASSELTYEDGVYRYYHGSYKVVRLQSTTDKIVEAFKKLAPKGPKARGNVLCEGFTRILKDCPSAKDVEGNLDWEWERHARPMVEAYLHAKYLLEMLVKFGPQPPRFQKGWDGRPWEILPYGWAAVLELYRIR